MSAPVRRKAPREHRGKCGRRTRQPRGQLTGCLWDVPLASSCRCSSTQPRSSACCLAARHGGTNSVEGTREHCGKCGSRTWQPRGPLTGCLWDVPPASACIGSRTPPQSVDCRLLPLNLCEHATPGRSRLIGTALAAGQSALDLALYSRATKTHWLAVSRDKVTCTHCQW